MMHLHQDNSEQKKLIKWNVSYIIQENWAHRSHSKDEKKNYITDIQVHVKGNEKSLTYQHVKKV